MTSRASILNRGDRQEHPPHEQSWEHHEGGHVEIRCAHRPRIADRMILVPYGNSVSTMIRNTALALCMGLLVGWLVRWFLLLLTKLAGCLDCAGSSVLVFPSCWHWSLRRLEWMVTVAFVSPTASDRSSSDLIASSSNLDRLASALLLSFFLAV